MYLRNFLMYVLLTKAMYIIDNSYILFVLKRTSPTLKHM